MLKTIILQWKWNGIENVNPWTLESFPHLNKRLYSFVRTIFYTYIMHTFIKYTNKVSGSITKFP